MTFIQNNPLSNFFSKVSDTLAMASNNISDFFSGNDSHANTLESPDTLFFNNVPRDNSFDIDISIFDRPSKMPTYNLPFNTGFQNSVNTISPSIIGRVEPLAAERLKRVSTAQLAEAGKNNKSEFFKLLLPAALEAERIYGVPASVTLAQAALESGWGKHAIGGYNIFGIKGKGPAGTVNVGTKEFINGKYVSIKDNFAKYNNFYEAVMLHGKLFHAGYKGYTKGLQVYKQTGNDNAFIDAVGKTYATSPTYSADIKKLMKDYDLVNLSKNYYV